MHPMTAALDYAQQRYRVFPCRPDKRPATANGFKDATTDYDQIRTWWVDDPDYLIGIATGSGLLVIDLDAYKTGEAAEWARFIVENGGLPETYTTRTGRDGLHYWFRVDEEIRSTTNLFPSVDVRADGGYIIAPPSVSVHGSYDVVIDTHVEMAPRWLVSEILDRRKVPVPSEVVATGPVAPEDVSRFEQYAARAYELEVGKLRDCTAQAVRYEVDRYDGPAWNETTFEVACNLLEIANSPWNSFTEDDAYRALWGAAPRDAGFTDRHVLRCWDSARKTTDGKTRPAPPPQGGGVFIPFSSASGSVDPDSFFVKGEGLDALRLATEVVSYGPLAVDHTQNRSIWTYRNGVWAPDSHVVSDRCSVLLGSRFRPNHVATILPIIRQQCSAQGMVITCDPVPDYINVQNGMLHWRTGVLYSHDPSFYSTVQLPVVWEPEARCPRFSQFASEVMAPDALTYLWEIIGYLCYSGNPLQRAFLFHGAGINGKGTLIRVLKALLGEQNVSEVTLTDIAEARFEVSSLHGKIANLAGDIDASYMKSTARFKAITGEDAIRAERKYEHGFSFTCWAVPVFSANEFWKSADTTTGYKRRWQLLPFPNTFEITGAGQGLTDRLVAETSGILTQAVAALQRLMARGDFDTPLSAQVEKSKFELAADQVSEWLNDDVVIVTADPQLGDACSYPKAEAYKAYRRWAEESGNSALPSSKWWQRMESLGFTRYKSGVVRVRGLSIDPRIALQHHVQHLQVVN